MKKPSGPTEQVHSTRRIFRNWRVFIVRCRGIFFAIVYDHFTQLSSQKRTILVKKKEILSINKKNLQSVKKYEKIWPFSNFYEFSCTLVL
uniref:Uncharacterized protein n=1 Tax=Trichogramma kaykai TaxID=54128 RepID=A0ABD2VZA7_9HYME